MQSLLHGCLHTLRRNAVKLLTLVIVPLGLYAALAERPVRRPAPRPLGRVPGLERVAYAGNGHRVALAVRHGMATLVHICDIGALSLLATVQAPVHLEGIDLNIDGSRLIGRAGTNVFVWDAATGRLVRRWNTSRTYEGEEVIGTSYCATTLQFVVVTARHCRHDCDSSMAPLCVRYINVLTGSLMYLVPVTPESAVTRAIRDVAVSPDGRFLVLSTGGARSRLLHVYDIKSRRQILDREGFVRGTARRRFEVGATARTKTPLALQFSPRGQTLALVPPAPSVSDRDDGEEKTPVVRLWDLTGLQPPLSIDAGHQPGKLTFSPDGRCLALHSGSDVVLWDVRARRQVLRLPAPASTLDSNAIFSADSRLVAIGNEIRNTTAGKLLRTMGDGKQQIDVLAFAPNGARLLTYDDQGAVRQWRVR